MEQDLKLIREKLKLVKKMSQATPKEYNLKHDLLRHWKLEEYKLAFCIKYDKKI
jgi:hypothetical protein